MTTLKQCLYILITLAGALMCLIGAFYDNPSIFVVGFIQFIVLASTIQYSKNKYTKECEAKFEKITLPIVTLIYLGLDILIIVLFAMEWWG